jgi:hypothetical protein
MKTRLIALLALLMLIAISCKENSNSPDDQEGWYQPLKIGNWWKYETSGTGMPPQITYNVDNETTINGKKWFVIKNDYNSGLVYYRYEGTVLMMKTTTNTLDLEYKVFDNNGKTGDSLITQFASNGISYKVVTKITEKGTNITVKGKEYKDCLKVDMVLYTNIPGTNEWGEFLTEEDWFALNIGLIYMDAGELSHRELLEYSLK